MAVFRKRSFRGGVHPPEAKKLTEKKFIKVLPIPQQVSIPIQQHIGAPSEPIVEKGDTVKVGDKIAEARGFVSIPSHASISGTVKAVEERPHPLGVKVPCVVIVCDQEADQNGNFQFEEKYLELSPDEMRDRIREAGLAGMGGAAFPTHVKLSPPAEKPIHTFILNGAECEPYLTSDHRLMLEKPKEILLGVQIIMKILGCEKGFIGIENNKPDAVSVMRKTISEMGLELQVLSLRVKYPQGAEKQLIKAVTGRQVPSGGLPMDVGCLVQNVGTAAAAYEAVAFKKPFIERVVTVTGNGVKEPKNVLARIGTAFSYLFDYCGGLTDSYGKIIMGGPMMGIAQYTDEVPVIKGTSGIVVIKESQSKRDAEGTCISCARCVDVCPMGLMPTTLVSQVKFERLAEAEANNLLDCIECGSCAYLCPAKINLVQWIKFGKVQAAKAQKAAG